MSRVRVCEGCGRHPEIDQEPVKWFAYCWNPECSVQGFTGLDGYDTEEEAVGAWNGQRYDVRWKPR